MITGLAGASIWSEDLSNLLPFYPDVLGLEVSVQTPGFVVLGGLGLGTHSEVRGRNADPARHMVGLTTDDIHMVTHAIDHGVTAMAAATVLSAAGLASLSGKIICGLVADRVGAKRVLLAGLSLQVVAVSLYLVTRELSHFYAVALMFGFAYGGVVPLYAILVRESFGPRTMGTTFGAVGFASTLGMALGPLAGGWLYDAFGSYVWLFIGSCGIGLGAVAIAFTFRPPRQLPTALPTPSVAH